MIRAGTTPGYHTRDRIPDAETKRMDRQTARQDQRRTQPPPRPAKDSETAAQPRQPGRP